MTNKAQRAAGLAACLMREIHTHGGHGSAPNPSPEMVSADALALLRIGASVSRWAVRECNGEGHWRNAVMVWDDSDESAKEKADARALKRATEIAERYGATVKLGGDPRGYVLRLVLASGRTNTMGNDGWGVA